MAEKHVRKVCTLVLNTAGSEITREIAVSRKENPENQGYAFRYTYPAPSGLSSYFKVSGLERNGNTPFMCL